MKTPSYTTVAPPPEDAPQGFHFPDVVVHAFALEAQKTAPELLKAHTSRPEDFALLDRPLVLGAVIPLEQGKQMIIDAFTRFDPKLGDKAREIFGNPEQLELKETAPEDVKRMQCRPARSEHRLSLNPENFAVIDYDYDKTIRAVVFLAHELGHAIADDYQLKSGNSHKNNPGHLQETQAYLMQNVMYDYLQALPDKSIAQAAGRLRAAEMASNIYDLGLAGVAKDALEQGQGANPAILFEKHFGREWEQLLKNFEPAQKTFDAVCAHDTQALQKQFNRFHDRPASLISAAGISSMLQGQGADARREASELLLGGNGPSNISAVLEKSGITGADVLQSVSQKVVAAATKGLTAPEAPQGKFHRAQTPLTAKVN